MKLTKAQRAILECAVKDGGEIIINGLDKSDVPMRRDVVWRLYQAGFIKYSPGRYIHIDEYKLTDLGRAALKGEGNG